MELSEAKKELEQLSASIGPVDSEYLKEHEPENYKLNQAIDTVLKALDNKYYEMAMKEQNNIINHLKSKLDNSISKDDIRKKMDNEGKLFIETRDVRYANRRKVLKELLGEE